MRSPLIHTVIAGLLFAAVPVVADQAEDEAAIKKANEQRVAARNTKDVKAYLSFFDEDCTVGWGGGPCAAVARESGEFPASSKDTKLKILDQGGVVFITPDVAIYRYTQERTGSVDADGKPKSPEGFQAVRIFVKKDGKWLLAVGLNRPIEE